MSDIVDDATVELLNRVREGIVIVFEQAISDARARVRTIKSWPPEPTGEEVQEYLRLQDDGCPNCP